MTKRFRRVLSTKRMNDLSRSSSPAPYSDFHDYHEPIPPPPSYNSIRNIPLVPTAPTDARAIRFRSMLHTLANMPMNWENPGLLDEALRSVPLERIYAEADEESQINQAEAASLGHQEPKLGYQDCLIKALMKWFRGSFFSWVNNPYCATCGSPTQGVGMGAPSDEEKAHGANSVEIYKCSLAQCGHFERFPRYNDAFVLMTTRRGRVGEWTNCFGMLCRAMGLRVRWIWNSEDHVWVEIFSTHQKRWVHVDPCEGRFDQPRLYTQGWGRKLSYCIAFSRDGATDVTRRYVRNFKKHGGDRIRCTEPTLLYVIEEIRNLRRRDLAKPEKFRLKGEDMKEDKELAQNIAIDLALELCQSLPGAVLVPETRSKAEEAGQAAQNDPTRVRGPNGATSRPNPHHRPEDQR
ncbi:hypothetical protein BT63DRAFT_433742 [Microthyrium microscopicum]|uniref:Transglutaminase-like domain-containing protein n=1 Tax=Microthyrium microscopicum TaxID=703497 RepID=A0A6A6U403_9PEZI|nr:hypothetical protein BT63DRAFT_433742 [Microthyrium microscopicum]